MRLASFPRLRCCKAEMGRTSEAPGVAGESTLASSPWLTQCATWLRSSASRRDAATPSALLATSRHGRDASPGMYRSNSCA
eukprot:scaffold10178_cov129-Isochrysis_galbana.AAC.7